MLEYLWWKLVLEIRMLFVFKFRLNTSTTFRTNKVYLLFNSYQLHTLIFSLYLLVLLPLKVRLSDKVII